MRVYDLLEFIAKIHNISGKAFKNALTRVIEQCGLKGVIHKNVAECSKGYKQRIGLACAMIHDPKILILDEPVTGLDPNQIVEIRNLIKDLGSEKLVLMSSHILQEIQATVDRIIIIHNGEIVADGTSEELISDSKGMTQLHLEIQNTDENAIQDMKAVIPSISIHSLQKLESSISAILEYPNTSDPRKDIFDHAVQHGWTILAMSASKRNLEDIFRNLTQEGDPAHA